MTHATHSTKRFEWMYKSVSNPVEWHVYSDIEIAIIEEQYQKKQPEILLDDYCINFKNLAQISNHNQKQKYTIRRVVNQREEKRRREACFMLNPMLPSRSFTDAHHRSSFLDAAGQYFNLSIVTPYGNTMLAILVEKVAEGIFIEAREGGTMDC